MYVGETARSVSERSSEHWNDLLKKKDETHMYTHWMECHEKEVTCPTFNFRVVKGYKSCLARQVGEAVRIQLRGNLLNKKGIYNRSKLTRMVVDEEWEKEVWTEAWEGKVETAEEVIDQRVMSKSRKTKNKELPTKPAKKRKVEQPKPQFTWESVKQDEMLPEGWTARVSKPNIAEWFRKVRTEAVPSPNTQTAVEVDDRKLETNGDILIPEGENDKVEARPNPTDPIGNQDQDHD